jgi:hypothetical protein
MANKITITEKQGRQFNRMLATLRLISRGYQTPDQLRKKFEKVDGIEFEEAARNGLREYSSRCEPCIQRSCKN